MAWALRSIGVLSTRAVDSFPGGNAQHELQNFIKNLGIFAGLLLLAARRPGV